VSLIVSIATISPAEAKRLIGKGATLIDIRGTDEYARERIPGALNTPLDALQAIDGGGKPVVFHCRTGNRTAVNAAKLAASTNSEAFIVEGGIEAWKVAGLQTTSDKSQPIEIMRQVQITAGSLVLLGVILSQLIAPGFIALSAFIGAGLIFAGVSSWCGMAKMLATMPWNRRVGAV
jgi:rhodanese-related sulfurtransferase